MKNLLLIIFGTIISATSANAACDQNIGGPNLNTAGVQSIINGCPVAMKFDDEKGTSRILNLNSAEAVKDNTATCYFTSVAFGLVSCTFKKDVNGMFDYTH